LKSELMQSKLSILLALTAGAVVVRATTLQQLTLPEMARKSTAIVRARVVSSHGALYGADVYTVYRLEVLEPWKGGVGPSEVAVPGGVAQGIRQEVAGAPTLRAGQEYVLFLWTSRSGWTQIIGLTQGLFTVQREGKSEPVVNRPPATELMLDASGRRVRDEALTMKLSELKAQVQRALRETVAAWVR
jgi:hypothetical protein